MNELIVEGEFMLHDGVSSYMVPGVGPAIQLRATSELLHMVKLFVPRRQGSVNMANPMTSFRADSLFVAGVFQLQQNNYDARVIFVPIDVAKGLLDYTTEATQVEVFVTDSTATPAVMQRIVTALGPSYAVKDRLMQQDAAYRLVNVEKWMAFLLLAFILVIATFNVIGTLSLLIIEKRESIDVMRSLGADTRLITRIFIA
jgi:ABC-type lipoprotein release transport system permease subunit